MAMQANTKHIYSPLRYPGGKSCIFSFVGKLFYENNLLGVNYAEPYAGGAGLALRLLFEGYVEKIYINDIDRSIYAFWHTVLNDTQKFCKWIEKVEVNVDEWRHSKKLHSNPKYLTDFELAQSTFFLNRTNVSGIITGGPIGGLDQKGKYKIDCRFNKQDLINRIQRIASLRERIIISNLDGVDFLKKMDGRQEDIFIYLDPPYFAKGAHLYLNFYKEKDHRKLSKYVSKLNKRWMVSYDNQDFIINLYAGQKKLSYKLSQCVTNRIGDEVLIFSDRLNFKTSIQSLNSPLLLATR